MDLQSKINQLKHECALLARQSVEVVEIDRKQSLELMRQARDKSKEWQELFKQLQQKEVTK
jgi:hypothetical protein